MAIYDVLPISYSYPTEMVTFDRVIIIFINARRMRTRVMVLTLCVCVCPESIFRSRNLYYKMNIPVEFSRFSLKFKFSRFA